MMSIILENADRVKNSGTVAPAMAWGENCPDVPDRDQLYQNFRTLIADSDVSELLHLKSELEFMFSFTVEQRGQLEDYIAYRIQTAGLETKS